MPQRALLINPQPGYDLSPSLWNGMDMDAILSQNDRNFGFGFKDDFDPYQSGKYGLLATGSGTTLAQVAETYQGENGIIEAIMAATASHENMIQRGNSLSYPFVMANYDMACEIRLRVSAITAAKWSWFFGLATLDSLTTAHMFTTASAPIPYASDDFIGIWKAASPTAGGGAISAMYQNGSGNYVNGTGYTTGGSGGLVDGSVSGSAGFFSGMGNIGGAGGNVSGATGAVVASAGSVTGPGTIGTYVPNWINLGFRYRASPGTLSWYINGVEWVPARLGPATLNNIQSLVGTSSSAYTFPNATFMSPTFAIKNTSGTAAALDVWIDWMACAQNSPSTASQTQFGPDSAAP